MFVDYRHRGFGFIDLLVPVLSSAISAGGSIGSALITSGASKSIAKQQQSTQMLQLGIQQRMAQLQIEAMKEGGLIPSTLQSTGATRYPSEIETPSILEAGLFGVPTIGWILVGGMGLYFLVRRKK